MTKSKTKTMHNILGRDSVHPFPARMAPSIALSVVGRTKTPLRILDPMMGSGTVLALAQANGHKAIGIDIDPLAVLISKVWTTVIDDEEVKKDAVKVLGRAKSIFKKLTIRHAYPSYADQETINFIDFWFDPHARRQLTALYKAIGNLRKESTKNVLWCAISRLIIVKKNGVSLAMDLSHSRPHKVFSKAPVRPFDKFLLAVERVVDNCVQKKNKNRVLQSSAQKGDARNLPLKSASIDIVLTSPPYLNAIDYMRCSKFSLVWMGYPISALRKVRTASVGSELGLRESDPKTEAIINDLNLRPILTPRNRGILARYIGDMSLSIREVTRVLSRGGRAVYVVGENTINGTYIRNSLIVRAVAEDAGLKFRAQQVRQLPANRRYLPPPSGEKKSKTMDLRMRREVILSFTK